jgi:cellulase/cellobiase CelA1
MSGVRGRTGRKPNVEVKQLRTQMDEAISSSDWLDIWHAVVAVAKKGNIPAVRLLVEYRFGVASAQVEQSANVGMVAYYLPARSDQPLPASLGPDPHAATDLSLDPIPGPAARIPA